MTVDFTSVHLEVSTPERKPIELETTEVILPGAEGVFTVLLGHTPFLSTLIPGTLIARGTDGSEHFFAVNGGFAEVLDNRVSVMTLTAEHADEIDLARAEAARGRAERRLSEPDPSTDIARAETALRRAMARIQAHSRKRY